MDSREENILEVLRFGPSVAQYIESEFSGIKVRSGSKVGILSPSGTGKTSLFRAIAHASAKLHHLGSFSIKHPASVYYAPQFGGVFEWYTVRKNLHLISPSIESHQELLEVFGLSGQINKNVFQLSGGQKQRLSFLLAYLSDANLLLIDEPLVSVDISLRINILEYLRSDVLWQKKSALIASHDPLVLTAICNSIQNCSDTARRELLFSGCDWIEDASELSRRIRKCG
jgi:ABC-type multidrug transport system ATPase subunit